MIGLFLFISLIVLVFVLLTSNIIVSAVPVSSINCQQDSDCILKDTPYCCGDKVEYYKGCYSINETPKEVNCSSNSPCPWLAEINSLIEKGVVKKSDFEYEKYFGPEIIP